MLQDFSGGYFLLTCEVVPTTARTSTLFVDEFVELQNEIRTHPLVAKVNGAHLCVYPDGSMPSNMLAVPTEEYEQLSVSGSDERVLIAKEHTVRMLIEMAMVDEDVA